MRFSFLFIFSICFSFVYAQDSTLNSIADSSVIVSEIIVAGNSKTKTSIIKREIVFKVGDSIKISALPENLELSRNQIFNTTLFDEVSFHLSIINKNKLIVIFTVKERWYIFPLPYFKLVDRNFNEWWVTHKGSLDRVDYGMKFYHNNLSGNNDKFVVDAITGYSRQFGLRYNLPFFDKKMTKGLSLSIAHVSLKEVNYNTSYENKPMLTKAIEGFPKTTTKVDVMYTSRPNLFMRHSIRALYSWEEVDPFITYLNPNYYKDGLTSVNYLDVNYNANYIKTNYNVYPTSGLSYSIGASARFFSGRNNIYSIGLGLMYANKLSTKVYLRNRFSANYKSPNNTGYAWQQIFGYNSFQVRGMEYNVIDGTFGMLHKLTLGYEALKFNLKLPLKKNKYIDKIPFAFYAKVYNDMGYAYSQNINTNLNNRILHGYGFGVDMVTFYDMVVTFEYSFNNLSKNGIFLGVPL